MLTVFTSVDEKLVFKTSSNSFIFIIDETECFSIINIKIQFDLSAYIKLLVTNVEIFSLLLFTLSKTISKIFGKRLNGIFIN